MQMDIKLLEAFKTVIETRSVTQAANIMGVTQPAVSAQIAKLEEIIGFRLFDRLAGRLTPTNDGLSFYNEAIKLIGGVAQLERSVESIKKGDLGSLIIASNPSAGISLLPQLIAEFRTEHPDAVVKLITRNSEVVRSLFPSQLCDIGIAELPIDYQGLTTVRYRLRCMAILPKGHALAAQAEVTPKDLSGMPFFAISRERVSHHALSNAFADAGAEFNIIGEAELFASICGLVAAGGGVSVVDPWSAKSWEPEIVVRPFKPAIPYEVGVFHAADRPPSTVSAAFIQFVDRRLRNMGAVARRVRSFKVSA
jgi:DNA-binding transcriptional LysR family regulator